MLLHQPDILLLDEPTKGLDAAFKQSFAAILSTLTAAGTTVVMVSHDVAFCARYAHRCALFFDGSIVAEGTPRDFFSGNSEDIKKNALFKEMYRWIDNSVHLNVNDMFDAALRNTRIEMSPAERRQFYEKHIRHMTLTIDENGNVSIELKRG